MNISVKQQSSKLTRTLTFWQTRLTDWRTWLGGSIGLLIWIGVLCTLLYQFTNFILVPIGDYYDAPFLKGAFSERETSAVSEQGFRWTTGSAELYIPGTGRGGKIATVNVLSQHPDGQAVGATFKLANNEAIIIPDAIEPRTIHTFIPASATRDGAFSLRIESTLYNEPTASARTLGVALFGFSVASTHSSAWLPPLSSVVLLSLLGLGAALTLRLTSLATLWAYLVAALLTTAIAGLLLLERVPTVFWLPNLVALAWGSVLLIALLRRFVPWLCAKGGVELGDRERTLLLLVFVVSFWLKAGGQLYPYMIAIDLHWHMDRVRWILDGRLAEMYRPGAFNESVMPVREFGLNPPTIPYSPFFHIFATSFALLPWQLEITGKIFIGLLDATYVFIIYYVSQRIGFSRRSSILASAFYTVIPLTFLLQSWGNAPTAFGMWWVFITNAFIIGNWGRLRERKIFITLTILLLITFLIYTVMAVFISLLLIVWMLLIAFQRRDERPQIWAVASAACVAFAFAFGIYYAQYLPDIIDKTIPYFSQTLTEGQESVGAIRYQATAADNIRAYTTRFWNYGVMIPFLCTPLALWLVGRWRKQQHEGRLWLGVLWICAMIVIALLFVPIDRNVPMVDKHVIWLLPVWSILMSVLIDTAIKRWRMSWVVFAAGYAVLFFMAMELWIRRILTVKQVW